MVTKIFLVAEEVTNPMIFIRGAYAITSRSVSGLSVSVLKERVMNEEPFYEGSISSSDTASTVIQILDFANVQKVIVKIYEQECEEDEEIDLEEDMYEIPEEFFREGVKWDLEIKRRFDELNKENESQPVKILAHYEVDEGAPITHPALKNPQTKLEKVVSVLDLKLAKLRWEDQDLARSSNWLTVASDEDIAKIQQRWKLPEIYLTFLKNFSPLNVYIRNENFHHGLTVYGAQDLIEGQSGYSFNSKTKAPIVDWPSHFLVIADDGGDPYCIKIGSSAHDDSQVYTCEHGTGSWVFEVYCDSFIDFLKDLIWPEPL